MSDDKNETEPEIFVHPGEGNDPEPKHDDVDENESEPGETEPSIFVHPPKYNVAEIEDKVQDDE